MKKTLLFSLMVLSTILTFSQTTWTVEAGGTPYPITPDPYFSPQHLVIQQGDIVIWENIQGWHNITTTSGPEDFDYGPSGSGWTHEFTFTQLGFYEYECSVGEHALTQFGSITVEGTSDIATQEKQIEFSISPNPVISNLSVSFNNSSDIRHVQIVNSLGQIQWKKQYNEEKMLEIDVQSYPKGIYFLLLMTKEETFTERIIKL